MSVLTGRKGTILRRLSPCSPVEKYSSRDKVEVAKSQSIRHCDVNNGSTLMFKPSKQTSGDEEI